MLSAEQFREVYALLDANQTVDERGAGIDCGVQCNKHCCGGEITKYLLPGERAFLEDALRDRGNARFQSLGYFDTFVGIESTPCACDGLRELRPFNCRVFPYGAKLEGRRVVDVVKAKRSYMAPCWIETPGPQWRQGAIRAWQIVLDDVDCRALFARLTTLVEWNRAVEAGENPGSVLVALAELERADDDELWERATRFFGRTA